MQDSNKLLPLVYSCSGCSNVAQLANRIAVSLDREGIAEMSCIAGIGGNVKPLVNKAKSGRKIIGIDGCPLACVKNCLQQQQLNVDKYYELSHISKKLQGLNLKKEYKADCSSNDFELAKDYIYKDSMIDE